MKTLTLEDIPSVSLSNISKIPNIYKFYKIHGKTPRQDFIHKQKALEKSNLELEKRRKGLEENAFPSKHFSMTVLPQLPAKFEKVPFDTEADTNETDELEQEMSSIQNLTRERQLEKEKLKRRPTSMTFSNVDLSQQGPLIRKPLQRARSIKLFGGSKRKARSSSRRKSRSKSKSRRSKRKSKSRSKSRSKTYCSKYSKRRSSGIRTTRRK